MSETKLEYQVNKDGQIISVRAYKDTPTYTLKIDKVDTLPIPRYAFRTDRWSNLKRQVCHLPVLPEGQWYRIPGWPDKRELKRARTVLQKKDDKFMSKVLNGKTLETVPDYEELILYVRIVEK